MNRDRLSTHIDAFLAKQRDDPARFESDPNKHRFPVVGDLAAIGEELECARYLDTLDEVEFWVSNPERSSRAFSLQTSTDRFYPDFVCKLTDDRYLVVEHKGEVYLTNDDLPEKNSLGELWEKRSGGTCLY